ncbi:MAG: GntR family transcriptional regulator [Vicinamibacterales bacterium]
MNRRLPIPLYHQLKTQILQEIEAGRWQPDEQLPTEEQLSARYKVSKITVRQALGELANLGRIRREQGRGTFVQKPALEEGPRKLTSFTAEMGLHGMAATSDVLENGLVPAEADVAAKLGIAEGDQVFRLRRLRCADGVPMGLQTAYLPAVMVPGIEAVPFSGVSLYGVLESRYSLQPVGAKETLIAVAIDADEAKLLRVAPGSPGLAAERTTFLPEGQPLEYVQSTMRGDRYKIVLDLVRQP